MKRSSRSRRQVAAARRVKSQVLTLESLEGRLLPGDALLGGMVARSLREPNSAQRTTPIVETTTRHLSVIHTPSVQSPMPVAGQALQPRWVAAFGQPSVAPSSPSKPTLPAGDALRQGTDLLDHLLALDDDSVRSARTPRKAKGAGRSPESALPSSQPGDGASNDQTVTAPGSLDGGIPNSPVLQPAPHGDISPWFIGSLNTGGGSPPPPPMPEGPTAPFTPPTDDCNSCDCGCSGNPGASRGARGGPGDSGIGNSKGGPGSPGPIRETKGAPNIPSGLSFSAAPVRYYDGTVKLRTDDLPLSDLGTPWGHTRSWTNNVGYTGQFDGSFAPPQAFNGTGMVVSQFPFVETNNDFSQAIVVSSGTNARFFGSYYDCGGSDPFCPRFFIRDRMIDTGGGGAGNFVMTDSTGNQFSFYNFRPPQNALFGAFQSMTDPDGNVTSVASYDATYPRPHEVRRSTPAGVSPSVMESYSYSYVANPDPTVVQGGVISHITLQRQVGTQTPQVIRQVDYTYYNSGDPHGNPGDLKTAVIKDANGNPIDTKYYRYYTGEAGGYMHGLKYLFDPQSYARLVGAVGANPFTATDAQVAPYADYYFQYDASRRVTQEVVQNSGCSSCSGGLGTYTYQYHPTSGFYPVGYNKWFYKTTERFLDSSGSVLYRNIVYCNYFGEVMLKVFHDEATGNEWKDYYQYEEDTGVVGTPGRLLLHANPSAVASYDENTPGLVTLNASSGRIETTDYYPVTGSAPGYVQSTYLKQGANGALVKQNTLTYTSHTASAGNGGATIYPVATSTVYRNDSGSDLGPETTTYTYASWWTQGSGDTNQVKAVIVNRPTVPSPTPPPDQGQNGPGVPDVDTTFYDVYGRPTWHRNSVNPPDNLTADGYIDYTEYDQATGEVVKTIADVDTTQTQDFQNLPVDPHTGLTWATPAGGGLHLKTIMQVDGLGRTVRKVTPNAAVSLNTGNVIDTAYDDLNHAMRTYSGWNETTHLPTGPIRVVQEVRPAPGSMNPLFTQTLTMSASPLNPVTWATSSDGTYTYPTGMEGISAIQSLSRTVTNGGGQMVEMDSYFYLDSIAYSPNPYLGTANNNYYATLYFYDQQGRRYKAQSPTNTIAETDYDTLGRVVQTQAGTVGTAMTVVSQSFYDTVGLTDSSGVGDSNLTRTVSLPGGGAAARVTLNYYDWRDRLVATKQGAQTSENDGTHRLILTRTYDNLNEIATQEQYAGDGVTPQISGGVLVPLPEMDRRARTATAYDNQQRVYRTSVFNVVQSGPNAGTLLPSDASPYTLTTNTWYDHRGNVIKVSQPGGQVTKTTYDGANRAIVVHTSDDIATPTWVDAGSVANNNVLTQTETSYDKNGNAILVVQRDRFHDDPVGGVGLGELGTPAKQPYARVSYVATYYDLADRLTDNVNVGTNGGMSYARPTSPPPRSDTALVASYGYLADAVQTVSLTGSPTGGTFTLTFNGQTTQPINFNAASSEVQSKIQAILPVSQTVLVTGPAGGPMTPGGPWLVRFAGSLAGIDQPDMTADSSGLTGGSVKVTTTYRGGDSGRVQTMTDPRGLVTKTDFDLKGRTAETIEAFVAFDPSNSTDQTTRYTYDGSDHIVTLTAVLPGNVQQQTQYTYGVTTPSSNLNSNELLASITYPANGQNNVESFTYNALGQKLGYTDRNQTVHAYSYDVLGRQTKDAVTVGAGVDGRIVELDTAYDTGGRAYLFTSYARSGGLLVSANQMLRVYNGLSQLIAEYQAHSGIVFSNTPAVQYTYSEMSGGANHSRLVSMTYPNGRVIHYGYSGLDDSINRVSFLADDDGMGGIGTHLEDESFLGLSTVVKRSHPLSAGTLDLTYIGAPGDGGDQYAGLDRFGRVIDRRWVNTNTGTVTDDFTYTYDRDGNRLFRRNTIRPDFNEQYTDMSGAYDPLNRMTGFSRGSHTQTWGLDALGNWTKLTTDGAQTQTRTFNLQNQITSISGASTPAYDANGNTTTDEKGTGYVYDAWNRLVGVNALPPTTPLQYDAMNRRIQDDGGTQLYYSAGWQVVEERVGGAMTAQYVWSPVYVDALVERDTAGGQRLYVQQDANWNVTAITDNTGAVQERYVYDPYGQPTILTPNWTVQGGSAFGWVYLHQGGRFDTVSGLYYFRSRDYSPTLGRWVQQDPVGYGAGDRNLYGYVGENPASRLDPSGQKWWEWIPIYSTIRHIATDPAGTKVSDYNAGLKPSKKDCDFSPEMAVKQCEDGINKQAADFLSDWLGFSTGYDFARGLLGLVAASLGVWAIKTGAKGGVTGTITGGVLTIDAVADAAVVYTKAYDIGNAGDAAKKKFCCCPGQKAGGGDGGWAGTDPERMPGFVPGPPMA